MSVTKNSHHVVDIIDLTYQGFGVAKIDGFPVFIENTLPDEQVEIRIVKVLKRFAYGIVVKMIKESEHRVPIKDKVGTRIGTMPLQHMSYDLQLEFKKNQVETTLSKMISLEDVTVNDTLGMENPWHYRNKAQIPVREVDGKLETGFFKRGSHDLIPIENYYIQDPVIDEVILTVRDILRKYNVKPYNEEDNSGTIRNIIVRRSESTEEVMVVLVTRESEIRNLDNIVSDMKLSIKGLVSIIQNINNKNTNVIMGDKNIVLLGQDHYRDHLLNKEYYISSKSFFQVNTRQTEVLYNKAIELGSVQKDEVVVDAYCGIGTISLSLADYAKHVYAMEIVPDAIDMANHNAIINEVNNVNFECGKAEVIMPRWVKEGLEIDVLFVDPPRKGLDIEFIEASVKSNPKRIVYVSCNPASLARDLKEYKKLGYNILEVQPVDMFPQTTHVETIVLLQLQQALV